MSRRVNCWDNAVVEPVFRRFKHEWIGDQAYRDHAEVEQEVLQYLRPFYHQHPWHAVISQCPPAVVDALAL